MRNIFDQKKPKRLKQLKQIEVKKRYRYTYNELNNLPDDKLTWFENNGLPEERDMSREIRSKRKMERLVTYGY
jgi:uncharacterized protein (DUF3820 family)